MTAKSMIKSNNQKRGGKREGAGRKLGDGGAEKAPPGAVRRDAAVEIALGGLERALRAYERPDAPFTIMQARWHMAMVLFGVPTEVIGEAILKSGVAARFRDSVTAAVEAVKAA